MEMWKYHHNKIENSKQTSKLIIKLQNQADKWFDAFEKNDYKQLNRQFNRLRKTYSEINNSDLDLNTNNKAQHLIRKIETKSGRKV